MDFVLRFAYQIALYCALATVILGTIFRLWVRKPVVYTYPLTGILNKSGVSGSAWPRTFLFIVRVIILFLLALLIGRPQWVDPKSNVIVEGIDIILVLDVSGSMQLQDYEDDQRSRLEVAKQEAKRFINKRVNDAMGLVIFGNDALSRCPLTNDKAILNSMVNELHIGIINPDGTLLATGMLTALNRLKRSKAKSKIMILLTDGEPSEDDIDPRVPIEAAKQLGVKIYTVGIGSDQEKHIMHPFYGLVMLPKINKELLTHIAAETDGEFFQARNAHDMRTIYDTIDSLEKTEIETPIFSRCFDFFIPILLVVIVLLLIELICATFVWRGI